MKAFSRKRSKVQRSVSEVIEIARHELDEYSNLKERPDTVKLVKHQAENACAAYYSLAAASRRKNLSPDERSLLLHDLFPTRSALETIICERLSFASDLEDVALTKAFFGYSNKQGVSLRYALASCVPTEMCGGRCYAHDGRDRDLHMVFRGCLNFSVGSRFENGDAVVRNGISEKLGKICIGVVDEARKDQERALQEGYDRLPRIRFSHVGEIASTPDFANHLADLIHSIDPDISCVIYTRHPEAKSLDSKRFVVNFTLDSEDDSRSRFAPLDARVVASAWDGKVNPSADISFLEHHVSNAYEASGSGNICPVTSNHHTIKSCDEARCSLCFKKPGI